MRAFAQADRFVSEVEARKLRPVYVFVGDEVFFRRRCREALLKHLVPAELRDFSLFDFDLSETDLAEVLDRARTPSLMAPFQVFFVRRSLAEQPGSRVSVELFRHPRVRAGVVAHRPQLFLAEKAAAAGNRERHHDAIADLQSRAVAADLDDLAHELVAEHIAVLHGRDIAVVDMEIRPARIAVVVTLMIASRGFRISGSGTVSTRTSLYRASRLRACFAPKRGRTTDRMTSRRRQKHVTYQSVMLGLCQARLW